MKNNVADMINGGYYWIKGIKSDVVEIAQYFHNDKGFYYCGDTSLYKLDKVEIVSYIGEQYFTWS